MHPWIGRRVDEERTNLVQAHDLDDPRLEVEDLLVPDAHPCLIYCGPVHDVRLERLVDLLDDPVRDRLDTRGASAPSTEHAEEERGEEGAHAP